MRIHESSVRLHETYFSSLESGNVEDVENVSLENITEGNEENNSSQNESTFSKNDEVVDSNVESRATNKNLVETVKAEITPKKALSPKQLEKKQLSEQKKKQREMEREERERKRQAEKEEKIKLKEEKQKQKQEIEEQKKKEKEEKEEQKKKEREEKEEQKKKEKEEKEQKRKEKEQREELKRKEKEMEKLKKQQEIEEKNKEKQKQEEQKQKAAAVFANFFVTKKADSTTEKTVSCNTAFMPFEVKSDMRLAPVFRRELTHEEKENLIDSFCNQQSCCESYLDTIKLKSNIRTNESTWPYEEDNDDVMIVEDADLGETICDENPKSDKMRAKLLKFEENRRPAYFGTWRKTSKIINARRPFAEDKEYLDYEVDSDEDWEEEEQGESITGSDDEDKENESDNEYEVDNEFFVPHGHLSEDEMDDEENSKLSPESHKAKLKLLKNEFDEEMKCKTQKIKPRVIGCIWYKKSGNVDETIDRFLQPLAIISRGQINIMKRNDPMFPSYRKKQTPKLDADLIPDFLQLVHGNTNKSSILIKEFIAFVGNKNSSQAVTKRQLNRQLRELAKWTKCPENGPMLDKHCWYVDLETRKKHAVNLPLPNNWNYVTKLVEM